MPPGTWIQVDPAVRGQPIEQAGAGARWLLRTEGSEPMAVERLSLLKLELRLDARRQLLGFEGLLSRETALGDMTYPAGTRVLSGGLRAAGAQPGDLLFSARAGAWPDAPAARTWRPAARCCRRRTARCARSCPTAMPACWMWPRSGSGPRAPSLAGARKPPLAAPPPARSRPSRRSATRQSRPCSKAVG